jgi:hypothetical protein
LVRQNEQLPVLQGDEAVVPASLHAAHAPLQNLGFRF